MRHPQRVASVGEAFSHPQRLTGTHRFSVGCDTTLSTPSLMCRLFTVHELGGCLSLCVWLDIMPSGSTKRTQLIIFWIFASFFDLSQTPKRIHDRKHTQNSCLRLNTHSPTPHTPRRKVFGHLFLAEEMCCLP